MAKNLVCDLEWLPISLSVELSVHVWSELFVPRSHTSTIGPRAFAISSLSAWNSLPVDLRHPGICLLSFRIKLKTHLSHVSVNINLFFFWWPSCMRSVYDLMLCELLAAFVTILWKAYLIIVIITNPIKLSSCLLVFRYSLLTLTILICRSNLHFLFLLSVPCFHSPLFPHFFLLSPFLIFFFPCIHSSSANVTPLTRMFLGLFGPFAYPSLNHWT